MLFKLIIASVFLSISLLGNSSFGAIATGQKTGTYFKVGKDISTIFKKYKADLKVIPSNGSVDNLDILTQNNKQKTANWAIVQSDALQYYRYLLLENAKEDLCSGLKTILPLYNEYVHIFTKKGKKINFKKGSTLRVGVPKKDSDSYITAKTLQRAYGINFKFKYIDFKNSLKHLQQNKLDIVINVNTLSHSKYQNLKNVTLVNLPKNKIMNKRYFRAKFTKENYPWLEKEIYGYKVPNVIVTNKVDSKYNQAVGIFLKIILNNYKALTKYGHPSWQDSYRNRTLQIRNMHPLAKKLLQQ